MKYFLRFFQNSKGEFSKTATYFFIVFILCLFWVVAYIFFPAKVAKPDESLIIALLTLFGSLYWGRRFTEAWERRPLIFSQKTQPPEIVRK